MKRERITPSDAIWLQDSATNPMVINSVIIIDHLDLRTLRSTFQQRIFDGQGGAFERFHCRVSGRGSRLFWERDPGFDIRRHIIPAQVKRLDGPEAVQAYVGREASKPLDLDRPLWQFQLADLVEGATVILLRVHHSLGDGEALIGLLLALADEQPGQKARLERLASRSERPAPRGQWLDTLKRSASMAMSAPGILLRRLTWIPDRSPMHGPPLTGIKRVAWTRPLDLDVVKRANQNLGATVNDVLMASVSGAFSHYLLDHGNAAPSRFLVSMPMSVRASAKATRCGNYFAPVPLELPAGRGVHGHRILAVKERMDQLKGSPIPKVIYQLQGALLTCLPQSVSRFFIDFLANKCSAVVTNVKGLSKELTIKGRKVRSIMFWVPQRARIGIGISILSCSGKVQIGVIADEALVPNPAELIQAFEDEFETLKMLAALAPDQPGALGAASLQLPEVGAKPTGHNQNDRRPAHPRARPKAIPASAARDGQDLKAEGTRVFQEEAQGAPAVPKGLPGMAAAGLQDPVSGMKAERVC